MHKCIGLFCVHKIKNENKKGKMKMGIFEILVIIFGCVLGVVPTLYLIVEAFIVLGQKIYRKIKYNISLYD